MLHPSVSETTALGAAYAAGLAFGYWKNSDEFKANWYERKRWTPDMSSESRKIYYQTWKRAIERTFDWHQNLT